MFKIDQITKRFDNEVMPIHGLSTEIRKGDVIALIGPSGTGKSTFLRCLNMLDPPTSGRIFYKENEITQKGYDLTRLRLKVGMVFQSFNLFNHLTAIENIMMPQMQKLGKSRQEAFDRGMELLAQVGLSDRYLQYPSQLSGGQKQRVAIARAMAMDPEVLLMDEPTSALDPTMVDEVNAVIKRLASTGMTILIVTHDMAFARDISNRIFFMYDGIVYEEGTPDEIFDHPKKPETIRFFKRMFILEEDICTRDHDFSGLSKKILELIYQRKLQGNYWSNTFHVLEELFHNVLFQLLEDPFRIHLKIEIGSKGITLFVNCSGEKRDLAALLREQAARTPDPEAADVWMAISARVICRYAKMLEYSVQEGELPNQLRIEIKDS